MVIRNSVCVHAKSLQSCPTFCDPMDCSPQGSSVHGDSPGKNAGVGCHALLQGLFLTQGLNSCLLWLLHCRQILTCWVTGQDWLGTLLWSKSSLCHLTAVWPWVSHITSLSLPSLIHKMGIITNLFQGLNEMILIQDLAQHKGSGSLSSSGNLDCCYCYYPEKAMAPHSSTFAWKIPWMEEPGGLQSMGLLRVGHDWATSLSLFTFMHWRRKWQPTPVFLPGESQGRGTLVAAIYGVTQSRTWLKWLSIALLLFCFLVCMYAAFALRTRMMGAVVSNRWEGGEHPISLGTFIFNKPICIMRRPLRSQLDQMPPHFLSAQVRLCDLGEETDE